jgi:hypothetical protein
MKQMAEQLSRLMGLDEVADLLGVSIYTIRRLVGADLVKSVRIGARVMIASAEVARVQTEGVRKPRAAAVPLSATRKAANG